MLSERVRAMTPPPYLWLELDFSDLTIKELKDAYKEIKYVVDNEKEIVELKKAHYEIILKDHPEYYDSLSFKELYNEVPYIKNKENNLSVPKKRNKIKIPFMKKPKRK